jgi:hypothetical protein
VWGVIIHPHRAVKFAADLVIDTSIYLYKNNNRYRFKLKGILYYGAEHFTSRVVTENDMTWYHDGMDTGGNLVYEGTLSTLNLLCRDMRKASVAVYIWI